ncbi:site-specific integrase [Motilimonas cestriensis]|uniref:Site-specific integrase n=1 Tax=Motilimonas cestriensis TaxID=2742685 RepID=A0ABS8WDR5_9GAMM|nr:site-specific integrase [Motilimonas cestriensis]MCE2597187.1 site-specific integrase [Motilimonas cestriensis]
MARKRAITRLFAGKKKAAVVESKKQLKHLLWAASRGKTGNRTLCVVWFLFGSGLRVNEVAQLTVADVIHESGQIKDSFTIRGTTTKTSKPRVGYIVARGHKQAVSDWITQRLEEGAMTSGAAEFGGLKPDSPLILSKRGKSWRTLAFNEKRYKDKDGNERSTLVCSSLENLIRNLFKSAGLHGGSSHSGRRTLATWLYRKGYDLELIQDILGHESADMTLEYIDADVKQIKTALNSIWSGVELPTNKE